VTTVEPREAPSNLPGRLLGAAGLPLFLAYGFMATQTLSFGSLNQPGSAVMPMLVAVFGSIGSLGMVVARFAGATIEGDQPEPWPQRADAVRLLLVILGTALYVVALNFLGFFVSTLLFGFFLLRQLNDKGAIRNALTALAYAALSHVLFVVVLGVPLPRGFLV